MIKFWNMFCFLFLALHANAVSPSYLQLKKANSELAKTNKVLLNTLRQINAEVQVGEVNGGQCTLRTFDDSVAYCKSIGKTIATFHSQSEYDSIGRPDCDVYIGAASDGKGNWSWLDGSEWWQSEYNDGLKGTGETKIVIMTDGKWADWGQGQAEMGVMCQDAQACNLDRCGVCDGNDVCVDCNDVPNGGATFDDCGVCGGDGSSCECRDTSDGGPSEGEMCDTRWDHVTYWNQPEQYCRSDQPGRGCKYGYKRCGMNDCCCTSIDWDLNIGCTCF